MARTVTYLHQFLVNRDFNGSVILDLKNSMELVQMHAAFQERNEVGMITAYGRFLEELGVTAGYRRLIAEILNHIQTIQSDAEYAALIYDIEAVAPKSTTTGTVKPLWRLDERRLRIIRDLAHNREKRKLEKALAESKPIMFLTPKVRLSFIDAFEPKTAHKGEAMSAPDTHHDTRNAGPYHLENFTNDVKAAFAAAEEASKRNTTLLIEANDAAMEKAKAAGHSPAILLAIKDAIAKESAHRTIREWMQPTGRM